MTTLTIDEIIEFGKQAGLEAFNYPELITKNAWEKIGIFAKLVASEAIAKEREACAKLADEMTMPDWVNEQIAKAIRARGEAT